jgi:hypothetical protein
MTVHCTRKPGAFRLVWVFGVVLYVICGLRYVTVYKLVFFSH